MEQIRALTAIFTQIHAVPIMRCLVYTVSTDLSPHNRDHVIPDENRSPLPPPGLPTLGKHRAKTLGPSSPASSGRPNGGQTGCPDSAASGHGALRVRRGDGAFGCYFLLPLPKCPLPHQVLGSPSVTTQKAGMTFFLWGSPCRRLLSHCHLDEVAGALRRPSPGSIRPWF